MGNGIGLGSSEVYLAGGIGGTHESIFGSAVRSMVIRFGSFCQIFGAWRGGIFFVVRGDLGKKQKHSQWQIRRVGGVASERLAGSRNDCLKDERGVQGVAFLWISMREVEGNEQNWDILPQSLDCAQRKRDSKEGLYQICYHVNGTI